MSACEPRPARSAAVLIASTRAATGVYEDRTAPVLTDWLDDHGFDVVNPVIVPDGAPVASGLKALLALTPRVILTSGGTGLSADDQTPEMTAPLLTRHVPGVMEAIRAAGLAKTPFAALSRGHAGVVTGPEGPGTFIVNLPGSPSGVMDALSVLAPLIDHICAQLEGSHAH
ncbi:MogA/MoaB family molybdenum cofactor biosynthesis protein [Zhihengliuella flava]|uniref:Molybdenum cofactor synthesis domain-containing protein n=1 Tax=Zhihengliuella flava TaxID=1285193 RepID=A0A931D867_9MICC|nr:MogA/MoaB family molybdenum cofactor biosynthesis protein [Zhihengliuella flava]MBG6083788.1 molybdenum cofactor synthesis domain-containing protein [Zhihengliuella flava]